MLKIFLSGEIITLLEKCFENLKIWIGKNIKNGLKRLCKKNRVLYIIEKNNDALNKVGLVKFEFNKCFSETENSKDWMKVSGYGGWEVTLYAVIGGDVGIENINQNEFLN